MRLGTSQGIWTQTALLAACGALVLLTLPSEPGAFGLRDAELISLLLTIQMLAVTYLSSAVASSELALEGEKGIPDLAMSAFPARTIAAGKWLSSAGYALYLVAILLPLVVLGTALRGGQMATVAWAGVLTVVVATAAGVWGAWLGGCFDSEFARTMVHWGALAALFGGTAVLPDPLWAASPIRTVNLLVHSGWQWWMGVVGTVYLAISVLGVRLIALQVEAARAEGRGG
ncbi:MAG: hypothetical protein QME77_00265 [bacterium]|nr:hypothetical protein [bacterium]